MIPKECKRLAEVDFPIAEVSRHAVREKTIRHGHPSTLHLWWARRPLASGRAVLLGLLLPDPCDVLCPEEFKEKARSLLPQLLGKIGPSDEALRGGLLKFIGSFASWDLASNPSFSAVGRGLVEAAHGGEAPLVVDPFAGGGSIPLEALRLGCDVFASDLNPVACLILKVMLEEIPRNGHQIVDDLQRLRDEIKNELVRNVSALYPIDADGASPIAYLWARTVKCEAPDCGAELPLTRSFWLCKKSARKRALRYSVTRSAGSTPVVNLEIFEPMADGDVPNGTVTRAKATCLACGTVLRPERVRAQLAAQHGGADVIFDSQGRRLGGALLLAVVTLQASERGRGYRLPTLADYVAVHDAQTQVAAVLQTWESSGQGGTCPVPNEPLPPIGTLGFRVQRYGMLHWGDLFTARQKLTLMALSNSIRHQSRAVSDAVALSLGKLADLSNALCGWIPQVECPSAVFKLGRVKPSWDFVESAPLSDSSGSFSVSLDNLVAGLRSSFTGAKPGHVSIEKAQDSPLPDDSAAVWFTDPPYYDAIPYADLSDFFFVWFKRTLPSSALHDPFSPLNPLTPKDAEIVQDETRRVEKRVKDRAFFEDEIALAFSEGRRVLKPDGIASVVFAHQTTEGWEALLTGMIRGGWTITGSWPISTEMGHRIRARDSAALATSVHLICRPRPADVGVGDWAEVLRELPRRVSDWMERLQSEGVRGADLVFACIGPALEIFSRYTRVETAEGREVALAEYLEKVWEVVGRSALEHVLGTVEARARNGAAGALEEDARLTALFLWTVQSTNGEIEASNADEEDEDEIDGDEGESIPAAGARKGFTLIYDVVRRFAQPLGINLEKWDGRIIDTKKGVVRLLPVSERARQLFGADGAQAVATRLEQESAKGTNPLQGVLFPEMETQSRTPRGRGGILTNGQLPDDSLVTAREATTLDRVHAAMLLQSGGRTNALRALLKSEQERSPEFFRLANALTALYPKGSEEKRLLDAMLLAVPR